MNSGRGTMNAVSGNAMPQAGLAQASSKADRERVVNGPAATAQSVRVKLFARAKELAGNDTIEVSLPAGSTVSALREALVVAIPALGPLASSLHIAVNQQYAGPQAVIPEQAEIACFPPVSGG